MTDHVCTGYRDRLCRFGFELVERICRWYDTTIVVLSKTEEPQDAGHSEELQQDLLSIVNVFVARNNGRRSGGRKRSRPTTTSSEEEQGKTDQEGEGGGGRGGVCTESAAVSHHDAETEAETGDRDRAVDV